ncbi:hypothetical protein Lal_00047113 [Lupinus albus]|nr:hypothetical protein Lal_00047113 [Lupinus albus]
MAKPFVLSFSLCLLLFSSICLAERPERYQECQLDRLNALEPDNRVESEGGVTETWNSSRPELRCAGVTFQKYTIEPLGLHLPSYTNYPQLIMILQGEGALGISVPGCSETYEEPQQSQYQDSHQKIRHFKEGDIIAIPPGIPYWTYNYGDQQLVTINLLDTTSLLNQLDPNPRRFYLAGNPEEEYPETQEQQEQQREQQQGAGGRRRGKHQQEQEEERKSNVLSGFDPQFLTQALNVDEEIVNRLQNPDERTKQIVKVKRGLSFISPERQEEEEEEEEQSSRESQEHQSRRPQGRQQGRRGEEQEEEEQESKQEGRGQHREWERTTRRSHSEGEEGEEEEEETRTRVRRGTGRGQEQEKQQEGRRGSQGSRNGLEETICTARLLENIAKPSHTDLYNPSAGRIRTINSLTLPILGWFQLSAEYVKLYRNGIYAPYWNINTNSVLFVTRGKGRVQMVNCQGNSVFNDELRKGQLLVVPQNFVVAHQAGDQGFEFIAFKTNDLAATSSVKQVFRGIPAEVLANAFGLRLSQVSQLKYNGNQGPLVNPQYESEDHTLPKVA